MKIKLEKPITLKDTLLKKKVLDAEKKLEKKPRAKKKIPETSSITQQDFLTEQETRLVDQEKKQEKSISKETRTRRKITSEMKPFGGFVTDPIDERGQYNHEQEKLKYPIPENIPVTEDFTEDFDNIGLSDILKTTRSERRIKQIAAFENKEFAKQGILPNEGVDNEGLKEILGIKTPGMSYEEITESIKKFAESGTITEIEPAEETSVRNEHDTHIVQNPRRESMSLSKRKYRNDDWVNNIKPSKKSPEGILREQWQDNSSVKSHHFIKHEDGTEDHMKVYKDGTVDYSNANPFEGHTGSSINRLSKAEKKAQEKPWLSRLKNFLTINPKKIRDFVDGVQAEAKSVAEEFGWDEEKELEKQSQQYQESLKNEELHYNQLAKDWKEDIGHTTKGIEKFEESTDRDKRRAA